MLNGMELGWICLGCWLAAWLGIVQRWWQVSGVWFWCRGCGRIKLNSRQSANRFQDTCMNGVVDLFWAPGNFELIVFAQPSLKFNQSITLGIAIDEQLFVINPPSRKAPQLANILLTTRDQPDISIINPESDVWQHIKANCS
ncbi:hypothetical protein F5051DRAFT_434458 [Lentinula edodes]|nr:hypothetical protein F5051DRAFT_434458 [Lentinula edodes]